MSKYLVSLYYSVFYFVMSFCLGYGQWEFLLTRENIKGKGEEEKENRMKARGNGRIRDQERQ